MPAIPLQYDPTHATNMLSAALELIESGHAILPVTYRGKVPLIKGGCNAATKDPAQAQQWWGHNHVGANVAIATGSASDIFVVDIDGDEAEAALRELEARFGQLPQTVTAFSGRPGGRHLYYLYPGVHIPSRANVLGKSIDIRGDGGYLIAPPSVHPNGVRYRWDESAPLEYAIAPKWLIDLVTRKGSGPAGATVPMPPADSPAGDAITSGRHDALRALACNMRRQGATQDEARAALVVRAKRMTRAAQPTEIEDLLRFAWDEVPEPAPWEAERPEVMLGPDDHRVLDEVRKRLADYMRATKRHYVRNGQFVELDDAT